MKVIGNIIWFLLAGLWSAIVFAVVGAVCCITIVGIPIGMQLFKLASLVIAPFGVDVRSDFGSHPIANIIWILLFGWEMALSYLVTGIILCITIIGIPFGKQCFKLMQLAFMPFGAKV